MNNTPTLSLIYNIRPASISNAPLLLLIHGYGSDENDLFSFANDLPSELCVISIRAPYQLQPYGNAWYAIHYDATGIKSNDLEQARLSMNKINEFIDECKEHFDVDHNRVNLLGFSQGSILSYALSINHPKNYESVAALSGYLNEDLLEESAAVCFRESEEKPVYFISHGTVDQVIPYSWAQKAPKFLNDIGAHLIFKNYPIGHGVNPQNFKDLKEWMLTSLKLKK